MKNAKQTKSSKLKFIDLFAGIGGFHYALQDLGAECVFASEINPYARTTYEHNHKESTPELFAKGNFAGDIKEVDPKNIPDFNILCGGFPCQPFSQAGYCPSSYKMAQVSARAKRDFSLTNVG